MKICPQCNNHNEDDAAFCDNCGTALVAFGTPTKSNMASGPAIGIPGTANACGQCGHPTLPGEAFCENCGAPIPSTGPLPTPAPAPTSPPSTVASTASGLVCPGCGTAAPAGTTFCDNCGASLAAAASQPARPAPPPASGGASCPQCGFANPPGVEFCDNCGGRLAGEAAGQPQPTAATPDSPASQNSVCAGCNTVINLPEAAYCYKCGVPLTPSLGLSPAHCPACQVALPVDAAFCHRCGTAIPPAGVDVASPATSPYLLLVESNVKLDFPNGTISLVVGREDPVSDIFPEINLEPHDGEYGGVSRRHAVFSWRNGQWHVEDLDSTNFTFVNKQKLPPHQFTPVKNGDEIRFGKIATVFTQ